MKVVTSQITKFRDKTIENSYLVDSSRSCEIKRDLVTRQFICKILEYSHAETSFIKLQCLNKRFYQGILPNWLHETTVFNFRLSEGHLNQPDGGTNFEFPEPGYFSTLSTKEKMKVQLNAFAFSDQGYIFSEYH